MLFRQGFLLFLCLLLSLLVGCEKTLSPAEKARQEKIFLAGNGSECSRLDPQIAFHASERRVQMALFESLVSIGPNQEIFPALAQAWEVSEDGKIYTFYIRPNACWSDGSPLTAEDCAFSFERLLSPELASAVTWFAYIIEGAEAFNQGLSQDFKSVGIEVIDDYTLKIRLVQPAQHFLRLMAYSAFVPIPKHLVLSLGTAYDRRNPWDSADYIISNGPFRLKEWILSEHLSVEKNPYYWDAQSVSLEGINFFPIGDARTEEQAFRLDQLHLTYGLPQHRLKDYQVREPELLHICHDHAATELFLINIEHPPLNKVEVRQALNLAIDRKSLAKLFNDGRKPVFGFVPDWLPNYQTPEGLLSFDPEKAQQLMMDAGYPKGKGAPKITLSYSASTPYKAVVEALQQMWQSHLGLLVDIEQTEAKTNFYQIIHRQFDLARLVWRVECADAGVVLGFFASNSPANPTGWSNIDFDKELLRGFDEKDLEKRERYFQAAETILLQEAPIIPISYQPLVYLKKPYVHEWEVHGAAFIDYKKVFFEPAL